VTSTPREHVGSGCDRHPAGAVESLRRHVGDRAHHLFGTGQSTCGVQAPGDAEVDDLGAAQGEQDVRRLEVTMDHACTVYADEGRRDADGYAV
jgi:hypothetical protein